GAAGGLGLLGGAHRVALGCRQPVPGGIQPALAPVRQRLTPLPQGEGVLQRGGAALQPADHVHQLVAGLLIAERGHVGCLFVHGAHPTTSFCSFRPGRTSTSNLPWATRASSCCPSLTSPGPRTTAPLAVRSTAYPRRRVASGERVRRAVRNAVTSPPARSRRPPTAVRAA